MVKEHEQTGGCKSKSLILDFPTSSIEASGKVKVTPERYYATSDKPESIESLKERVKTFLNLQSTAPQKRIAFVTSGSPNIPIEKQVVRYLRFRNRARYVPDIAERFVSKGCRLIYLYMNGDQLPYLRQIGEKYECLTDSLRVTRVRESGGKAVIEAKDQTLAQSMMSYYKLTSDPYRFLKLRYSTIGEYMHFLKEILAILKEYGANVIAFFGADVPSCLILDDERPVHKISSGEASTSITLSQTPNVIPYLINKYDLKTFTVMLKLENYGDSTDDSLRNLISLHKLSAIACETVDKDTGLRVIFPNISGQSPRYSCELANYHNNNECRSSELSPGYIAADRILTFHEQWMHYYSSPTLSSPLF